MKITIFPTTTTTSTYYMITSTMTKFQIHDQQPSQQK